MIRMQYAEYEYELGLLSVAQGRTLSVLDPPLEMRKRTKEVNEEEPPKRNAHQQLRTQAKREYLLANNWTPQELEYKHYVHTLPSTAAVEEYQKKILAEASSERNSKTLMALVLGVNEKLLRTWEKVHREKEVFRYYKKYSPPDPRLFLLNSLLFFH